MIQTLYSKTIIFILISMRNQAIDEVRSAINIECPRVQLENNVTSVQRSLKLYVP